MKPLGLYLHIPFCERKCLYCDFNSYSGKGELIDEYVKGLMKEIDLYKEELIQHKIKSIFIGGGTPSLLSEAQLHALMEHVTRECTLMDKVEITLEANPGTLTPEKLKGYFKSGINRLSLGLQACQGHLLKTLGRIHSYEDFLRNVEAARKIGFHNMNVDLMFALPQQRPEEWRHTLKEMVALEIPHISSYSLIWEEDTPFEHLLSEGKLKTMDEEIELQMYHEAIAYLKGSGYEHYEISNFAKANHRCVHNQIYWRNENYLGLGAGAHSFLGKRRFSNGHTIEKYLNHLKEGLVPVVESNEVSYLDEVSETMFLGLRMMEGISIPGFTKRFGSSPLALYEEQLKKLKRDDLIEITDQRIYLTPRGIDLSNIVFQEMLLG